MSATRETPVIISREWLEHLPPFRRLAAELALADGIFQLETSEARKNGV